MSGFNVIPAEVLARPWAYEVDPTHPLAQGLAFCVLGGANIFTNMAPLGVTLLAAANANIALADAAPYGAAWKYGTADNTKTNFGVVQPIKTADGAGGGDFTVGCLAAPTSSATQAVLVQQRLGSSPFNQWSIQANSDKGGSASAGRLVFLTVGAGALFSGAHTSTSGADGSLQAIMGRRLSTAHSVWANRVDATEDSDTTVRTCWTSTQSFVIGGVAAATAAFSANCVLPIACGWEYGLPDALMESWSARPFQMIRPRQGIYVVKAPAATFNPAWARGSNVVLMPGLAA